MKSIIWVALIISVSMASSAPPADSGDEFQKFIQNLRKGDGLTLQERIALNPKAKPWENSGKYQGDILLDDKQVETLVQAHTEGRNAYIWPNTKWPDKTIPYEFGAGHFTSVERSYILSAMRDIELQTCIRFRPRTSLEHNYVFLTSNPDGCYAHVGYWSSRGIHILNLSRDGCFLRTIIIHEWLHIIGFLHMQSTYNRDDYVRVMWQNIIPGMAFNFGKYSIDMVSNLGLPYEYDSNLHYGSHGFSVNGQPTLVATKAHSGTMGQLDYVTQNDWKRVNRLYNCVGAWS